MKKVTFFVLLIVAMLFCTNTVYAVSAVPSSVLESSDSVVRIFCGDYTGSGFIVSVDEDKTIVATNYHVIESDPGNVYIWLSKESNITASVLDSDEERDLCLLKISAPLNIKPIPLCEQPANKGDAVYAVGFPGAGDDVGSEFALDSDSSTITDGIIGALRQGPVNGGTETVDILQVNTAINAGNSGGPVLNEKGSAVGISTFGITDSQGIFGAVAISELINLLNENGITYIAEKQETKISTWMIIGAAIVLLAVLIVVILVVRSKKNKKISDGNTQQDSTEWTFVRNEGGDAQDTDTLKPNEQQTLDVQETNKKKNINGSMIIKIVALSLCILLIAAYFVTYYLSRKSADEFKFQQAYDLLFLKPVTQLHDYDHFVYVDAGVTMNNGNYDAAKAQLERLGSYKSSEVLCKECDYQKAKQLLAEGNFDAAKNAFAQLESYVDSPTMITECEYQRALNMMNNGAYDEAEKAFKKLDGYKDSDNMAKESRYRRACEAEEKEDYYLAALYFQKIAKENYKDSKDRYQECSFVKAYVDFYDEEDYVNSYYDMKTLAGEGYQPAKEALKDMKEIIYVEAVNSYRDDSFYGINPSRAFAAISGYKDSDKYLTLIYAKDDWSATKGWLNSVLDILNFEDAREVVVSNTGMACEFLEGKWRTQGGGYYFKMEAKDDGGHQSSYNLPAPNVDGYFDIEDGVFTVNGTKFFRFDVESEDTMYVHCYKDGNDYYMYR